MAQTKKRARVTETDAIQKIEWADDVLNSNDLKKIWSVGKAMKKIVDRGEDLTQDTLVDIYFIWGRALSRLASLDDDPTLSTAAADKFEEIQKIQGSEMDAAALALWGNSLIMAAFGDSESSLGERFKLLEEGISRYQLSLKAHDGDSYEVKFQYAKALKDVADYCTTCPKMEESDCSSSLLPLSLCQQSKDLCLELQKNLNTTEAKLEDDESIELAGDVSLLHAQVNMSTAELTEDESEARRLWSMADSLFEKACGYDKNNMEYHIDWNRYLLKEQSSRWIDNFGTRVMKIGKTLHSFVEAIGFQLEVYEDIEDYPDGIIDLEELDPSTSHLLESYGQNLMCQLTLESLDKSSRDLLFKCAERALKLAHLLTPDRGCYTLARLYATLGDDNSKEQCLTWLETCESYDLLSDLERDNAFHSVYNDARFKDIVSRRSLSDS